MTDAGDSEQLTLGGAFGDGGSTDSEDDGLSESDLVAEAEAVTTPGLENADFVEADEALFPDPDGTVSLSVMQVDYTVEGSGEHEQPVMHVFGRSAEGTAKHVMVFGFQPYFYAPTDSLDESELEDEDVIVDWEEEDDDGEPYESIRGERLTKIFGRTPRDVGNIRDRFDHYEADVLFPNRFLIDKGINSGMTVPNRRGESGTIRVPHEEVEATELTAEPRINTFDIEVNDRNGFPEDGDEPIICLTSHDSYDDEYVVWLAIADEYDGEAPDALPEYDPIEGELDLRVEVFDGEDEREAERKMLEAFLDYIDETDPDVMTGWNFEDFDAPYFLDRLEVLDSTMHDQDIDPNRLSRVNEVWRSGWGGPNVKGRVVFDLLYAYKSRQFTELDSYRLDAVGETELDAGKERYTGDIGDLWENDPGRLLEYNLRDVELCVEIDAKQDIVSFYDEVRTFVGCKLEDAPTAGDAVDMYVLQKVHGDFVLPSKGKQESEDYEGGAVFDPITGVEEMVTVLDLKSLYPMCMVTINASPETKVDPDEFDGETYHAPNGTHFRKDEDGMIRAMVDELLEEREAKKELRNQHDPGSQDYERYDQQQAAVKVIMNCFSSDTDVLTPHGVRNIRDLDVGDEVYSLDPDTMEMEVKPVVETHEYPDYRGEMVDIQTSKIDFSVTPNHRMLVRKDDRNGAAWDDFRFVEAGDLNDASHYELPHGWDGPDGSRLDRVDITEFLDGEFEVWANNDVHGHTLAAEIGFYPDKMEKKGEDGTGYVFDAETFEEHRAYLDEHCSSFYVHAERGRKWIPRFYDGDDFLELLAWYITEGSVYTSEDKQFGENFRGSATSIHIAQDAIADGGDGDDHTAIGALLDRMEFDAYVDDRGYQFTSKLFGTWLETTCGGNSFEKRIPGFVFDLSRDQKERFLNTLIAGDGDRQVNSWRYTTSSEQLRDDVLRLCTHLGLTASYNHDSGSWRIYCTENGKNSFRLHRSGSTATAEDGAYCVTVEDNHTVLAGRNGMFQFVGQSVYGVLGWDRFRLYDKEMGAAVTATGREVIKFTEESANELGHEVAYGDTDSVMMSLGGDVDSDEAIQLSEDIEEHINQSYDEFARDALNAEFHRFQIEFEKLYRRFFQAGKKKRYAGHIIWKEGKHVDDIDITGFEYKRSDIAPITKEVQHEVIDKVVRGAEESEITEYIHDIIERFLAGEYSYDEIAIPGGIGKRIDNYDTDTAHVRGAKYANLLFGTNFDRGSKPKRLYLQKVHPDYFKELEDAGEFDPQRDHRYGEFKREQDVICFDYADQIPEEFEVDYDKMLDKTLKGPIARVIEALGISWEEVKTGQEQTGLGSFM
ncbi:DNA polymerase domain-containing protein [Haloarchaeobius sp. FL176]|uniref:DNA polymerase domain-containing protein n=1 Tax=Haloarchaeobius sp. FL176 TaxID=2967129 RepID=UPI0021494DD1|nr:DNA polymerase domain-containing protein [Haloarchaeobius sp. FL176]